jgi:N-acetylglucosaminyl-diphospho-decaprenol L-rhamnosyltransferase
MNLSIIIVNWNTRDLLAQCLDSVVRNPPSGESEIIVVDNASTDDSSAMVRHWFPAVRLIENTRNLGFVGGNNQALPLTCGKYILLLNSDTIVLSDALVRMVSFMDEHPDAGVVGGFVLNPDGTPQACFWDFPTIVSETAYAWGLDSRQPFLCWFGPRLGFKQDFLQVGWVLGATLMIRREALTQVGLLDENFFMYSEEVDWCYRVRQAGWKNYVLGAARIIHFGGQSSKQIPAPMKAELFRSKVKFFRKHQGAGAAALMEFVFAASIFTRQWMYRLRGNAEKVAIWTEASEYFSGKKKLAYENY